MKSIKHHLTSLRNYFTVEDTFEGYFKNIEFWLDLLGMNVYDKKWFRKMQTRKKIICSIFVCLIFLCSSFAFICAMTTYKDSVEDQVSSCLAGFFAIEIGIKTAILFYKRGSYRQIKAIINQCIREGMSGEDMTYRPILIKYQEFTKYFFHWLVLIYLMAVIILITFPFFLPKEWIYPTNFVIPGVAIDSYPGYAINYVFISISCIMATMFFIGFDCYIILLSLFLASRFELCGTYFSKIGTPGTGKDYLATSIKVHTRTLEFYLLCQRTLEPIVLVQLIAVVGIICCEMIIALINPFSQTILTFFSTVTQVFFYCGCAELVANKAADVATKLYGSYWYEIEDEKLKKVLILVLNRSQQPCYFSVGKYSPLSMETFGKISSITFRSFNCIRTFL